MQDPCDTHLNQRKSPECWELNEVTWPVTLYVRELVSDLTWVPTSDLPISAVVKRSNARRSHVHTTFRDLQGGYEAPRRNIAEPRRGAHMSDAVNGMRGVHRKMFRQTSPWSCNASRTHQHDPSTSVATTMLVSPDLPGSPLYSSWPQLPRIAQKQWMGANTSTCCRGT